MAEGGSRGGDPMKYYCIVFGLLVIVIAFVYFHLDSELEDYKSANVLARRYLTGEGITPNPRDRRPAKLGDMAVEIVRLGRHLRDDAGAAEGNIKVTQINKAAESANVRVYPSREKVDPSSKGYRTISRKLSVEPATLQNLYSLAYNIESGGRYRVFQMIWSLLDDKANSQAPYNRIGKSTLQVGFREAHTRKSR